MTNTLEILKNELMQELFNNNLGKFAAQIAEINIEEIILNNSYSGAVKQLYKLYEYDLNHIFSEHDDNSTAHNKQRYNMLRQAPAQIEKWALITALDYAKDGIELTLDQARYLGAINAQHAAVERGVDSIHMSKSNRLKHNPALHSSLCSRYFEKAVKTALLLESVDMRNILNPDGLNNLPQGLVAQLSFEEALQIYANKFVSTEEEKAAIRDFYHKGSTTMKLHDKGELRYEETQAGKLSTLSAEQRERIESGRDERELKAYDVETEWHTVQYALFAAQLENSPAQEHNTIRKNYKETLKQHQELIHKLYEAYRLCNIYQNKLDKAQANAENRNVEAIQNKLNEYRQRFDELSGVMDAHIFATSAETYKHIPGFTDKYQELEEFNAHNRDIYHSFEDHNHPGFSPYFYHLIKSLEHAQTHHDYLGLRDRKVKQGKNSVTPLIFTKEFGHRVRDSRGAFPLWVFDDPYYGDFKRNYVEGPYYEMLKHQEAFIEENPLLANFIPRLTAATAITNSHVLSKYCRDGGMLPHRYEINPANIRKNPDLAIGGKHEIVQQTVRDPKTGQPHYWTNREAVLKHLKRVIDDAYEATKR